MIFEYPAGATPIDPDEAAGLIPAHVTLQPVSLMNMKEPIFLQRPNGRSRGVAGTPWMMGSSSPCTRDYGPLLEFLRKNDGCSKT